MVEPREEMQAPERESRRRPRSGILFPLIALLVLAIAVGLLWTTGKRLDRAERRLETAQEKLEATERRLLQYSQELELTRERADAARRQALEAEQQAEESAAARLEAESEAERRRRESDAAREQARLARERSDRARMEMQEAREQLELIRKRREEELNRMQQALSRIAPTRRTPSGMVMELTNDSFQFDFDSAKLRPQNRELLSRIAGVLLASEGYRLFIDGHTDDIGTEEYNQDLSERRARSVRDYLVKAGVPEDVTTIQGFGKSNPLVKEKTRDARQKNRRVEIGIVDTIIDYRGEVRTAEQSKD